MASTANEPRKMRITGLSKTIQSSLGWADATVEWIEGGQGMGKQRLQKQVIRTAHRCAEDYSSSIWYLGMVLKDEIDQKQEVHKVQRINIYY